MFLPELPLDDPTNFPAVELALKKPDGLLAMGGDLSPARLISAYNTGIFPWFNEGDPLLWWSPSKRAIIDPEKFHVSRSLNKYFSKHQFQITLNTEFSNVIENCALIRGNDKVWITQEMRTAYIHLHHLGIAHSVEVWQRSNLVGGLYGVTVGGIFCGESMFSLSPNASKIALWKFSEFFKQIGGKLIECQMITPHLSSLGAIEISRRDYISTLKQLRKIKVSKGNFAPQTIAQSNLNDINDR